MPKEYHSLAADPETMPDVLKVTAVTDDGEIMAVQHVEYPIYGVQFHPESIMTPDGKGMIQEFPGTLIVQLSSCVSRGMTRAGREYRMF